MLTSLKKISACFYYILVVVGVCEYVASYYPSLELLWHHVQLLVV